MKITDSIANISMALSKFQAAVTNPKKESVNPHFKSKYADLDSIINAIRPALNECDLAFIQNPVKDENGIGVYTILLHKSGEYIQFDPVYIPIKAETPHQVGAAMTYARRYSLGAALGIATDEDDDANSIQPMTGRETTQQAKRPVRQETKGHQAGQRAERNLNQWKQLAKANEHTQSEDSERKRFFAICAKKKITEKAQKALVFGFTGKESRKDVTNEEFKVISDFLEKATRQEIEKAINEAIESVKRQNTPDMSGISDEEIMNLLGDPDKQAV
ncbi:ERF family protein [Polycladomyces sp. WAk]|uniref:ERF family protein n=1 Tax=Polycladomyces zharkentensis TaxID=2807616 RepID=A0ABS2WHZ3_9BACL|nr:ERF family protein [Polycladomyces sp. WAk]MBN2909131.1 ERF family protein [Polycladomyces sp. WAk]